MVRQISTIKYNLCPQFPAAVVTRYPSLTRALGNNYPRLEVTSFDGVHQNATSNVPVACPTEPTCVSISLHDQIFPERKSKNSPDDFILGNRSFPKWQERCLPTQSANTPDDFIPIRNFSEEVFNSTSNSENLLSASSTRPGGTSHDLEVAPVDEGHRNAFIWQSSVPVARLTEPTYHCVFTGDPVFPTNNSVLGDKSSPKSESPNHGSWLKISDSRWPDRNLPVHIPTSVNAGSGYFIPICNSSDELLDTKSDLENLTSLSVGSPRPPPYVPSTHSVAEHSKRKERRLTRLQKVYDCLLCSESFTRPSDLRTHKNMHTSKQPFVCNFAGCVKRFGVGSNLQRHKQVAHGIRRAGRDRSVVEYKFKFEPLSPSPTLISDTTPMASEIVWDNEGPFSRWSLHWPGLQTIQDSGGK